MEFLKRLLKENFLRRITLIHLTKKLLKLESIDMYTVFIEINRDIAVMHFITFEEAFQYAKTHNSIRITFNGFEVEWE